jgi:hypothetical protein
VLHHHGQLACSVLCNNVLYNYQKKLSYFVFPDRIFTKKSKGRIQENALFIPYNLIPVHNNFLNCGNLTQSHFSFRSLSVKNASKALPMLVQYKDARFPTIMVGFNEL